MNEDTKTCSLISEIPKGLCMCCKDKLTNIVPATHGLSLKGRYSSLIFKVAFRSTAAKFLRLVKIAFHQSYLHRHFFESNTTNHSLSVRRASRVAKGIGGLFTELWAIGNYIFRDFQWQELYIQRKVTFGYIRICRYFSQHSVVYMDIQRDWENLVL